MRPLHAAEPDLTDLTDLTDLADRAPRLTTRHYLLGMLAGIGAGAAGVGTVNSPPTLGPDTLLQANMTALAGVAPQQLSLEQQYLPQYANLFAGTAGGTLNQLLPFLTAGNTALRGATTSDLSTLGPGVMNAWQNTNPGLASLVGALTGTAQQQLAAGSTLGPQLTRNVNQVYNANAAARGLGTGEGDAAMDAYLNAQMGQQLLSQRMGLASNAAGTAASVTPNPFSILLGQSAGPLLSTSLGLNGAGPNLFDPLNSGFINMYLGNLNAQNQANIASADNSAKMYGGASSSGGGGSGMGGLMGLIGML